MKRNRTNEGLYSLADCMVDFIANGNSDNVFNYNLTFQKNFTCSQDGLEIPMVSSNPMFPLPNPQAGPARLPGRYFYFI